MKSNKKWRSIYVLSTESGAKRRLFRIGETFRHVGDRIGEHDSSNVEDVHLYLHFTAPFSDKRLHRELLLSYQHVYRAKKGKEVFCVDLQEITDVALRMGAKIIRKPENTMRKLRSYQELINAAVRSFFQGDLQRGQVYSPTGSGKTECFIHTMAELIEQFSQNEIICLVYPRLALSKEQLDRVTEAFGSKPYYISFNSDRKTGADLETTDPEEVVKRIQKCKEEGRQVFILTTYHSVGGLEGIKIKVMICDEAHNATNDNFIDSINRVNAEKILFYTATPIIQELYESKEDASEDEDEDEDSKFTCRGMNNQDRFGPVIVQITPKYLIDLGYIVEPLIHHVDLQVELNYKEDTEANPAHVLGVVFKHQYADTVNPYNALSSGNCMEHCVMLATMDSTPSIAYVNAHLDELREKLGKDINGEVTIFSTDTNNGQRKNGEPLLGNFSKAVREHKGNAIVMHWGQIGEGIDIPSITGTVNLRSLSPAKTIQYFGRAGRPFFEDYNPDGSLKPVHLRRKKFCIFSAVTINGKIVTLKNGAVKIDSPEKLIKAFRSSGYDDLTTYLAPDTAEALLTPPQDPEADPDEPIDVDPPQPEDQFAFSFYSAVVKDRMRRELTALNDVYDNDMSDEDVEAKSREFHEINATEHYTEEQIKADKLRAKLNKLESMRDEPGRFTTNQPYNKPSLVSDLASLAPVEEVDGYYIVDHMLEMGLYLENSENIAADKIIVITDKYCELTEKWCQFEGWHHVLKKDLGARIVTALQKRQTLRQRVDLLVGQVFSYRRKGILCRIKVKSPTEFECLETGEISESLHSAFFNFFTYEHEIDSFTVNAWYHPKNEMGLNADSVIAARLG